MDRYTVATFGGNPITESIIMLKADDGQWVKYSDVEALQARVRELENVLDVLYGIATVTLAHPPEIDTKVWIEIATIIEKMKGPRDEG